MPVDDLLAERRARLFLALYLLGGCLWALAAFTVATAPPGLG